MRYIIRRPKSDDFSDVSAKFPDLAEKLGTAGENFKRTIGEIQSPMRSINYKFVTRKVGTAWQWVCPSIELVGETETDLLALTESFGLEKAQLTHLS